MRLNAAALALAALLAPVPCRAAGGFSFAVITDLHVGHGSRDFAGKGYDDKLDRIPEDAKWAANDREAVRKVNALKDRLKFVLVTGDLTDSAERSEFEAARLILDELEVPYLPLPGNHDIWPLLNGSIDHRPFGNLDEADGPIGDRFFEETFADAFTRASATFPDLQRAPRPTDDPESRHEAYFQNFAFSYGGYGFVALDWNSRQAIRFLLQGTFAHAQLHDFDGGTYRYLQGLIDSGWAARQKKIFMFQHHPFRSLVPDFAFTFSKGEKGKLRGLLGQARFWGVFAGHLHYSQRGPAFNEDEPGLPPEPPGAGPALLALRDAAASEPPDPPEVGDEKAVGHEDPRFQQVVTSAAMTRAQVTVVDVLEDGTVLVGRY